MKPKAPFACFALFLVTLPIAPQEVISARRRVVSGSGIVVTGKTCFQLQSFSDPTCTWSTNPSIGETIHCVASNNNGTNGTPFSVSDSVSNTYTANGSSFLSSNLFASFQFFDSFSITGSPSTTTLTTTGSNQNQVRIGCITTTGGSNAADGAIGTADGNTVTSMSATVVPTGSADLAICWAETINATAAAIYTPGSGFTLIGSTLVTGAFQNVQMEYKILSASGSQSVSISWDQSSVGGNGMICGTWK